jgi:iron complex transport system ATP-binding protein
VPTRISGESAVLTVAPAAAAVAASATSASATPTASPTTTASADRASADRASADRDSATASGSQTLEVHGLSFAYGEQNILNGISFTTYAGDLVALLGPNGVGKSTLFRCILGFLKGYTGSISLAGKDIRQLSALQLARMVAYIPQSSTQVFDYTVLELVLLGVAPRLKLLAVPGKKENDAARSVLSELGIDHLRHRGCGQISGGEYQLVLLARALLQRARILLMDEPTANLDYGNQYRVMERITKLAHRDFTVILSTHDPNQVLLHANRSLIVQQGRIFADGAPTAVMTEQALSGMFGINVCRTEVQHQQQVYPVCIPVGLIPQRKEKGHD